jgi:xanthine dehydrogenase FAD-binding subunit
MVEFYRPQTLGEALQIRAEHAATPLAGGTDLLVRYRNWAGTLPKLGNSVVYVGHLPELGGITVSGNGVGPEIRIGAAVTYSELLAHPSIPEIIKRASWELSAPGLRNIATLVGNICNASPAADAVCALYVLDAEVEIRGKKEPRRVPLHDFIQGPGKTILKDNELVTAVYLPAGTDPTVTAYHKVGTRRANALSKLSFCGVAALESGSVVRVAIAVGAVAPTVVRSREVEQRITGLRLDDVEADMSEIMAGYDDLIKPIDDQRSTAVYRKQTAHGLIERFLRKEMRGAS